jgi:hypothetical protein
MKFRTLPESEGGGSDKFLKIKPNDNVKIVLRGEIYEYFVKWEGGKSIVVKENQGGKLRFRVNALLFDQEQKKFVAKIWEFGQAVYRQLADVNEEYDLETTKIKVSRKGEGKETEYNVLPLLKEPLSDQVLKMINETPLNVLEKQGSKGATHDESEFLGEPPPEFDDGEKLPF